jgi:hypothetical protein
MLQISTRSPDVQIIRIAGVEPCKNTVTTSSNLVDLRRFDRIRGLKYSL